MKRKVRIHLIAEDHCNFVTHEVDRIPGNRPAFVSVIGTEWLIEENPHRKIVAQVCLERKAEGRKIIQDTARATERRRGQVGSGCSVRELQHISRIKQKVDRHVVTFKRAGQSW